jgi:polyhydroxyalkanoate synthesis regulator phasin
MEEHKSTAGQGLGIAGLILGILAIPMGIIPCTFYIGILFGIIGIVLSLVALSQANRGYGPRTLIIAALVCSIVGLVFASAVGFTLTRYGARTVKEIIQRNVDGELHFDDVEDDARDILHDLESDTAIWEEKSSDDLKQMTDTLKSLESESETPGE